MSKRKTCASEDAEAEPKAPSKRTKAARSMQITAEVELMRQKIHDHQARGGTWEHLKPNSRFCDGIVQMQCAACLEFFPRTTEFYGRAHNKYNNMESSKPGLEDLLNSKSQGCKACSAKMQSELRKTPKGFVAHLTSPYPLLNRMWVQKQLAKQNNRGYFTGFPLALVPGHWQASVHNLNTHQKTHYPENCVLDILELNVHQGGCGRAIPSLPSASIQLFQAFLENYGTGALPGDKWLDALTQMPVELGISWEADETEYRKQCRDKHLPLILSNMINNHHGKDKKKKRYAIWKPITKEHNHRLQQLVVHKIIEQGCRCAYSGIPLTWTNGWHRLSFERLDNSRPHFEHGCLDNVVFVCRILNGRAQMSRGKMLELILGQTKVLVPPDLRIVIETELIAMKSRI